MVFVTRKAPELEAQIRLKSRGSRELKAGDGLKVYKKGSQAPGVPLSLEQ